MALNIFIDGDRALDLLLHRVRDNENLVYNKFDEAPTCRYHDDGCPSCLIGAVLFDAGVPIEVLKNWDNLLDSEPELDGDWSGAGVGIEEVPLPDGLVITEKAMMIFKRAQGDQDMGSRWADAFAGAIEESRNFGPEKEN